MSMDSSDHQIRRQVRDRYARAAKAEAPCCAPKPCGCGRPGSDVAKAGGMIGYSAEDLTLVPDDSNLGLGCGNPTALAELKKGETILDLGSGAGIDCFLAAAKVGPSGRVIGVDMTPEMLDRARENVRKSRARNIEFRLGEIENLPAADGSVDAVISNCVINLSTDKDRVFREAFRILRPGGRLMVSDLALAKPLPPALRESVEVYVACVAGALLKDDYLEAIRRAGFRNVEIVSQKVFPSELVLDAPKVPGLARKLGLSRERLMEHISSVLSLSVRAVKPDRRPIPARRRRQSKSKRR
jgi:arsenite methyltransferase